MIETVFLLGYHFPSSASNVLGCWRFSTLGRTEWHHCGGICRWDHIDGDSDSKTSKRTMYNVHSTFRRKPSLTDYLPLSYVHLVSFFYLLKNDWLSVSLTFHLLKRIDWKNSLDRTFFIDCVIDRQPVDSIDKYGVVKCEIRPRKLTAIITILLDDGNSCGHQSIKPRKSILRGKSFFL